MADRLERVAARLRRAGLRLAVAESCTGGLLAARLTDPPGASAYLAAGIVAYADDAKQRLLGVRPETLAAHGAVSDAVVREMLGGARSRAGADAAMAITGVAGPAGGTADKPVGTVWIAAAVGSAEVSRRYQFSGDRGAVREASVEAALELIEALMDRAV